MQRRRIPIFPLNVVLFPGMVLPLHIFEPRYREMVRRCLEGDRTFGVCLIAEGTEVGPPTQPFEVGTTCEIRSVTPLQDGRMHLLTYGVERFRIRELIREAAYLEAEIELVPDEPPRAVEELSEAAHAAATGYIERTLAAQGEARTGFELPHDPVALSHLIGSILPVPQPVRQALLETSVEERLRRGLALLEMEAARLADPAPQSIPVQPFQVRRAPSPN